MTNTCMQKVEEMERHKGLNHSLDQLRGWLAEDFGPSLSPIRFTSPAPTEKVPSSPGWNCCSPRKAWAPALSFPRT
ncbi:hypothetical protein [Allobaculum sp. Allo2]|uniref:hypothetical protein n=1 Tax=Allobaculum sp. Allo2 TaxID=2853432 RepID=UPI001F617796|nr:hypothetical protein [Allobaculum sp. Allo2]